MLCVVIMTKVLYNFLIRVLNQRYDHNLQLIKSSRVKVFALKIHMHFTI